MTSQQQATASLVLWRLQRQRGIPPENRLVLPINDNRSADDFERDLQVIRECLERK